MHPYLLQRPNTVVLAQSNGKPSPNSNGKAIGSDSNSNGKPQAMNTTTEAADDARGDVRQQEQQGNGKPASGEMATMTAMLRQEEQARAMLDLHSQ